MTRSPNGARPKSLGVSQDEPTDWKARAEELRAELEGVQRERDSAADLRDTYRAALKDLQDDDTVRAAKNIALYLAREFYPDSEFKPLDSLSGLLSQIDNMAAGLGAKAELAEAQLSAQGVVLERVREALEFSGTVTGSLRSRRVVYLEVSDATALIDADNRIRSALSLIGGEGKQGVRASSEARLDAPSAPLADAELPDRGAK